MKTTTKITPALRFNILTPLYDRVVRYTTRERRFKAMLLDAASIKNGESVLDIGCGTGTLLMTIADRAPAAKLTGLDADPNILAIADRKLRVKRIDSELVEGRSTDTPFADATFDHVVSTLFFHHLAPADRQATISEIHRVLRPGGSVHVADWGRPTGTFQRLAFYPIQLLDGFATTDEHVQGKLTTRFGDGGFDDVNEIDYLQTMFGTLHLIRATKADV